MQNCPCSESLLLSLFKFCPSCKSDGVLETHTKVGTMLEVKTVCGNPVCKNKENVWRSQPTMPNTRIFAGNLLLSFGILVAGTSATKVLNVFKHMGLACISLPTFYTHQRVCASYGQKLTGFVHKRKTYFFYIKIA